MQAFFGIKQNQTQAFLEDGTRIPVTHISALPLPVIAVKTMDKTGYTAFQIGLGLKKRPNKATLGHIRGAKLEKAPSFFREIRLSGAEEAMPAVGDVIVASDVFKAGDIVDVTGISKGKGFAGGVKRHHFKGGPRTHGQSDRERAPGSIGQTTTPGRVYKGKRMAGRMGVDKVTVKNIQVVNVSSDVISLKGLVPGGRNTVIMIKKVGEDKKFVPLYQEEVSKVSALNAAAAEGDEKAEAKIEKKQESAKEEVKEETKENAG